METRNRRLMGIQRAAVLAVCNLAALCHTAPTAFALIANWEQSDLDIWVYNHFGAGGTRAWSPTFMNVPAIDEATQQFKPMTADEPARLGTTLIAFNTAQQGITSGLAPHRYRITSLTIKATIHYFGDPPNLLYDDRPISQSEILGEIASQQVTNLRPMELYGAGLRSDYSGYEFGGVVSGPPWIDEGTSPFLGGSYFAFPIVGSESQPGSYVDVMNSVTGGFSQTEASHSTAAFTPTPWAIGKTTELSGNNEILDLAQFTFDVDLNAPGVEQYVQQSLANGGLGFFISSLHSTGEFGSGGGFPRWLLREAAIALGMPQSRLPKLTIEYEIAPPIPGDYNDDGTVNGADYVLWRNGGPLLNQVDDPGQVNQQDYVEWRTRFGNPIVGGELGGGQVVPEPAGIVLLVTAISILRWSNVGKNCR
jgi:hypothetical protein